MLRNLFAASADTDTDKHSLVSSLHALPLEPSKLAGMLAVFIVPISALGWWCYSVVMSVGAMAPLQSASESSSKVSIPSSSINSDTSLNAADVTSSMSNPSDNSSSLDVDIHSSNNSSQTTVKVDGQTVPIADQGTTHKVIQNDNGQTTVDITIDSDTTGRATSRSSTDINLRSSSSSDVDIRSKEIR